MTPPNADIRAWSPAENEYLESLRDRLDREAEGGKRAHVLLTLDSARVYALLKLFVSTEPNGVYTAIRQHRKPLDNFIWWDFVLTCEGTILHVVRTMQVLEAWVGGASASEFDPEAFLEANIRAFAPLVTAQLENFERHTVYINHHQSYRRCVEWIWSELSNMSIVPPPEPPGHFLESKKAMDLYTLSEQTFVSDSYKFHALAKSLILNAAFMTESCLNMFLRIGAAPPLKVSGPTMKQLLRANFRDKLALLKPCCVIFQTAPDLASPEVRRATSLMELRNKYVHADESSRHNRLAEIMFDGDFPLHPVSGHTPGVEFALRVYHNPDQAMVREAYEAARAFPLYMLSLIEPIYRDTMERFLEETQISFNHAKQVYSVIYASTPASFFMAGGALDDAETLGA